MAPATTPKPRASTASVAGGLSLLNGFVLALGIITGPLQARALGPAGRGQLQAILVVAQIVPLIASFGLAAYATREVARGTRPGDLVGSIGGLMLLIGIVLAPLGLPISQLLGHGRTVVSHWVLIFFLTLPLSLVGILLSSFLGGLSRWKLMAVSRLIPIVLPAGALIVLYFLNAVTVSRLALVAIVAGIASILPALIPLRHWRPLRVRRELIRAGVPFGLKSWASFIASLANGRLDQLLMTGLASSSQLGLYAVAVTFSLVPNVVSSAVAPPLLVRVAAGERHLVGDALRVCLAIVVLTNLVMAGIAVVLIPLAFGPDFGGAVPMAAILLLAAVPLSGTEVLGGSLVADGAPSIPSIGEYATLAVTVPGLVLLLPLLGGVGAALVSLVAYSANFTIQLAFARRRFECSLSTLLLPTMADVRWGLRLARAALHRIGAMPKMVKGNSHKPGL